MSMPRPSLFASPMCPFGHGKLRGYTIGSRLIVETLLLAALFIYLPIAFFVASGSAAVASVVVLWVVLMAGIVILDYFVLRYRCSECGLKFTRRELAARDRS
jgi:uncharacterized membrane protein YdbT with pleckstrin-like domain